MYVRKGYDAPQMTPHMTLALHAVLTLAFTPGLGPRKIRGLLEHFGSDALSSLGLADLTQAEGVGPKLAQTIVASRAAAGAKADAELTRAERLGVTLLALGSPDYPPGLAQIYDPPPVLYVPRGAACGCARRVFSAAESGRRRYPEREPVRFGAEPPLFT